MKELNVTHKMLSEIWEHHLRYVVTAGDEENIKQCIISKYDIGSDKHHINLDRAIDESHAAFKNSNLERYNDMLFVTNSWKTRKSLLFNTIKEKILRKKTALGIKIDAYFLDRDKCHLNAAISRESFVNDTLNLVSLPEVFKTYGLVLKPGTKVYALKIDNLLKNGSATLYEHSIMKAKVSKTFGDELIVQYYCTKELSFHFDKTTFGHETLEEGEWFYPSINIRLFEDAVSAKKALLKILSTCTLSCIYEDGISYEKV
jgi:hypothetical protein